MTKSFRNQATEEKFLNLIKGIYKISMTNIIPDGEKKAAF